MNSRTHVMIGIATGITAASSYSLEGGILLVTSAIFGSIFPDIDHPKSRFNQRVLFLNNKFFKILTYSVIGIKCMQFGIKYDSSILKILAVASILTGFSVHRGFTHSLLGLLLYSTAVKLIAENFNVFEAYKGFTLGYISHLVADFFTKGGICIFYPFGKNITSPCKIKTGGFEESFIEKSVGVYSLYLLLKYIGI